MSTRTAIPSDRLEIEAALAVAARAESVIVDGYHEAGRTWGPAYVGPEKLTFDLGRG
jgi:hypothetical protein